MILILGSGRSGTTFLAKLFDSHPEVIYRHEPDSIIISKNIPFQPKIDELIHYIPETQTYINKLASNRAPKTLHTPFFPKRYRTPLRQNIYKFLTLSIKLLAKIPILEHHLQIPDLLTPGCKIPVPVIKSVNSLNRARLFSEAFPDIHIIHIIRHPCGVVSSQIRGTKQHLMNSIMFFDSIYRMSYTHQYKLERNDIESRSLEEQTAFQWMVMNDQVLMEMKDNPRYRMVRYEDLCLNTSKVISELFTFCGLDQNSQTDAFINYLEHQNTNDAPYFSVVRSPRKTAYKWRNELSDDQINCILSVTQRSEVGRNYSHEK